MLTLQWRHNGCDCVSNHQPRDCLLNRLFRRRSKKTSKLRVTGLCPGNSPGTGEFPAQMASNAENVSIWWRHHGSIILCLGYRLTLSRPCLTHWGRVTHICVSKQTIIGSDNGLSPGRRQAIIWTNAGILLIGPLGTKFNEISIKIHTFSFKEMHLKMSSGKWRPFCLGLNVLKMIKLMTTILHVWFSVWFLSWLYIHTACHPGWFEYRTTVRYIYSCPISLWTARTWQHEKAPWLLAPGSPTLWHRVQ